MYMILKQKSSQKQIEFIFDVFSKYDHKGLISKEQLEDVVLVFDYTGLPLKAPISRLWFKSIEIGNDEPMGKDEFVKIFR